MKLDPGFINHWKTELLVSKLGPDGVLVILRLWGNAQIKREYSGLQLTPKRLALETKWLQDENHLWEVLTNPDAPWLDQEPGGTWQIHGFAEHQHQVVKLWENGKKGGRPKKESPPVPPKEKKDSSPSSSSYPICEPNENHMVSVVDDFDILDEPISKPLCTLAQAKSQAPSSGLSELEAEFWWHSRNSAGWTKATANGGHPRKITSWQSDMASSVEWVREHAKKNSPKKAPYKPNL